MAAREMPTEPLTRGSEDVQDAASFADPDWAPFRTRLYAELAPASLQDRLLVEAILAIAARAFNAGQGLGLHLGARTTDEDTLAWIDQIREQHRERAALAALSALEALLLRGRVDGDAAAGTASGPLPR